MEFRLYVKKQPNVLAAVVIDAEVRAALVEKGFVNPQLGDMFCKQGDGNEYILEREKFDRLFEIIGDPLPEEPFVEPDPPKQVA